MPEDRIKGPPCFEAYHSVLCDIVSLQQSGAVIGPSADQLSLP